MCLKCRVCAAKGRGNGSIPTAIFSQTLPFSNLVFRLFIEVSTSTLIVGYNTVQIKGGLMNLLCVSFEKVGADKVYLKDVMETKDLVSYDDDEGDTIETWNPTVGSWGTKYFYVNQPDWDDDPTMWADTWFYEDEESGDWIPCNPEMESGASFWLNRKGGDIAALGFAGQVSGTTHVFTPFGGQMNLCGNPLPTVLNLADKSVVEITGATSYDDEEGDTVETWNPAVGSWGTKYFYVNQPDWDDDPTLWADTWFYEDEESGDWIPGATAIPAGTGFWYHAINSGVTITFKPLIK